MKRKERCPCLLPHRRSKTARPGSPILPLSHLPCPRSCQDLPPPRPRSSSAPHHPPTQPTHPAPSRRRKQPVRGDLRFREARTGTHCNTHTNGDASTRMGVDKQEHTVCPDDTYIRYLVILQMSPVNSNKYDECNFYTDVKAKRSHCLSLREHRPSPSRGKNRRGAHVSRESL